jgi:hypothetical protein
VACPSEWDSGPRLRKRRNSRSPIGRARQSARNVSVVVGSKYEEGSISEKYITHQMDDDTISI